MADANSWPIRRAATQRLRHYQDVGSRIFACPRYFIIASLLWGAHLGSRDLSQIFKPETAKEMLGLLAATAVVIVPVGFLISTLSVMLLRALALIARTQSYEAVLSDSTLERIWGQLQSTQAKDKKPAP